MGQIQIDGQICGGDRLTLSLGTDEHFAEACKAPVVNAEVIAENQQGHRVIAHTNSSGKYSLASIPVTGTAEDKLTVRAEGYNGFNWQRLGSGLLPTGRRRLSLVLEATVCPKPDKPGS